MNSCIVIPALNPTEKLFELSKALNQFKIIIVNDGSSTEFKSIFDQLKNNQNILILNHTVNLGKGAALKTAFQYIKDQMTDIKYIVTCDADGQHHSQDIINLIDQLSKHSFVLGVRNFDDQTVPFKSKLGNKITRFLCKTTLNITDTQTGLRGFHRRFLDLLINIPYNKYEYETQMLFEFLKIDVKPYSHPIQTIYFDQNQHSFFHPINDSYLIYSVLFKNLIKFNCQKFFFKKS